jgi:hypothetical protein
MSNPMISGLGAMGDGNNPHFTLPPIKSANGQEYQPSKNKKNEQEDEKKLEITNGMVLGLAAVLISANHEDETASHFWKEASREMSLEGIPRKAEWAEWATQNAMKTEGAARRHKNGKQRTETFVPHPDHPKLSNSDVIRYRAACDWAKKAKADAENEDPRISAPTGNKKSKVEEYVESPREEKRKNKGYWKKDDDGGGKKKAGSSPEKASDNKKHHKKGNNKKSKKKIEKPRYAAMID